jgi:hypothetical protein
VKIGTLLLEVKEMPFLYFVSYLEKNISAGYIPNNTVSDRVV